MPRFTLYVSETPNGWKAPITAAELGVDYNVQLVSLSKNEQKEPWFLEINPNGRIPALVDHDEGDFAVFESGALMQYLAEKAGGKLLGSNDKERSQVMQWLFFQMAGVGPMQGQLNHFARYAPEELPYAIQRYYNETDRLYGVLEKQLEQNGTGFLVGDSLSIADIANWCWVECSPYSFLKPNELQQKFPSLYDWMIKLAERPAFRLGLQQCGTERYFHDFSDEEMAELVKAVKKTPMIKRFEEEAAQARETEA
ncbi:MAG: hypothetical protein MHM6MM_007340 [Cercozoa sp. M6MM]